MKKRNIGFILLATMIVIVGVVVWGSKQSSNTQAPSTQSQTGNDQADIIFYFGQECSHCKNVEKFIADNQIDKKVIFAQKEVWHNTANNDEMTEKATECALDPTKVGVPFVFARGKCYIGEIDVENFFKKEAGIQ